MNDLEASRAFYVETLGFAYAGERPPFTVVRVNESTTLQLARWGTEGNQHLAFALPHADFEAAFARTTCSTRTVT